LNKPHNLNLAREGESVPETWDPACYHERAKTWREKAMTLPEDHPERAVCIELADGYDRLATLLEQRGWPT
jgi:hypothetical protein